jgi:CheY-like chemotaxis protein
MTRRALPMSTRVWPLFSLRRGAADGSPNDPRTGSGGFLLLEGDRTRAKRLLPALQSPCAHFEDGPPALGYLLGQGPFHDRETYPLPRAILLDLEYPADEGMELLRTTRFVPALKLIPLIVFRKAFSAEDLQEAYANGAVSCIEFPVDDAAAARIAEGLRRYWLDCNLPPHAGVRRSADRIAGSNKRSPHGP